MQSKGLFLFNLQLKKKGVFIFGKRIRRPGRWDILYQDADEEHDNCTEMLWTGHNNAAMHKTKRLNHRAFNILIFGSTSGPAQDDLRNNTRER